MLALQYEALVKKTDNINPQVAPAKLYQAGDIVRVRPRGSPRGSLEEEHFYFVPLGELTEKAARRLQSEIVVGPPEKSISIARRRFKMDVHNTKIEDKMYLKEIKQAIKKARRALKWQPL